MIQCSVSDLMLPFKINQTLYDWILLVLGRHQRFYAMCNPFILNKTYLDKCRNCSLEKEKIIASLSHTYCAHYWIVVPYGRYLDDNEYDQCFLMVSMITGCDSCPIIRSSRHIVLITLWYTSFSHVFTLWIYCTLVKGPWKVPAQLDGCLHAPLVVQYIMLKIW